MGSFVARIFIHDGNCGTKWQALFWVAMVVCIGLGIFYGIVAMTGSGEAAEAAVRGGFGCLWALGYILGARALAWILVTIMGW